jgi:hypothetical protein
MIFYGQVKLLPVVLSIQHDDRYFGVRNHSRTSALYFRAGSQSSRVSVEFGIYYLLHIDLSFAYRFEEAPNGVERCDWKKH